MLEPLDSHGSSRWGISAFVPYSKSSSNKSSSCNTIKNVPCEALRSRGHYAHSLGYIRYYDFICHNAAHRYFWRFPYGFSAVWLYITALLLLFLERARTEFLPSLCRAVCNRKSGEVLHSVSRGGSPLDFTAIKVIFDTSITVRLRSAPLLIPYKTSTYKRLTLPWPWRSVPHRENAAPQGGLINLPEQPLPIDHLSYSCLL